MNMVDRIIGQAESYAKRAETFPCSHVEDVGGYLQRPCPYPAVAQETRYDPQAWRGQRVVRACAEHVPTLMRSDFPRAPFAEDQPPEPATEPLVPGGNLFGLWYVAVSRSARRGDVRLLMGPFGTWGAAQAAVPLARGWVEKVDGRAPWYGVGPALMAEGFDEPGEYNAAIATYRDELAAAQKAMEERQARSRKRALKLNASADR